MKLSRLSSGFLGLLEALAIIAHIALPRIGAAQAATASSVPPAVQDNSFLVEEAYNQEEGVVQHITSLNLDSRSSTYELDFTQEWPAPGITHQLSYMIPLVHTEPRETGLGDIALNYRYQLIGNGDAKVAVAPRFSTVLPTGNWRSGVGNGTTGFELFLPASVVLSDLLVVHLNTGARYTPRARDRSGNRAGISKCTAAGSVIIRPSLYFHLLLETVWTREQRVVGPGMTSAANSVTILPGARAALNFSSGLQIVPGIGFPVGVGPTKSDRGVFLYLSFEHPFSAKGRRK